MWKQLKFILTCVVGMIFLSSLQGDEISRFLNPSIASTNHKHKAWYSIDVGNISIGLLTVGLTDLSTGYPSSYVAQIATRIGYSPVLYVLRGNLTTDDQGNTTFKQTLEIKNNEDDFNVVENTWQQSKNSELRLVNDQGANWDNIFPSQIKYVKKQAILSNATRLLYFATDHAQDEGTETFIPFIGAAIKNNSFKATYDRDGFLKLAQFLLDSEVELTFRRIDRDQYLAKTKEAHQNNLDFIWFSPRNTLHRDLADLDTVLEQCSNDMRALNTKITREMPQNSYLLYRRVINTAFLCSDLGKAINRSTQDTSQKLASLSRVIKKFNQENPQEIPNTFANSSESTLYYNDTIAFLWPRITSDIIKKATRELENNFALEKNRKALVGITLDIKYLKPRAVVRAQIKLVDADIDFKIATPTEPTMSPASLKSSDITSYKANSILNGQFFAKNPTIGLDSICAATDGKIGLDIGDAPEIIISTDILRGTWDLNSRLALVRQFALQASIANNCTQVSIRTPLNMKKAVITTMEKFKRENLGVESEILLSNAVQKRLWILPGKYRLVVTSLVSGNVYSAQEFTVSSGVNNHVTARIN